MDEVAGRQRANKKYFTREGRMEMGPGAGPKGVHRMKSREVIRRFLYKLRLIKDISFLFGNHYEE